MMLPKEVTKLLFAHATTKLHPSSATKKYDLTTLCKVLTPLLLSIPYNKDGVVPLHHRQ